MGSLSLVALLDNAAYNYLIDISDFEVFESGGRTVLYSASVAGNGLSALELTPGLEAIFFQETSLPERGTLAPLDLAVIDLPGATAL